MFIEYRHSFQWNCAYRLPLIFCIGYIFTLPTSEKRSNKEYLGEGNFSVQDDQNNEEIGDEFDEAEWSDAEDYGYSTKFPYSKIITSYLSK